MTELVDTKQQTFKEKDVDPILRKVDEIYSSRGKNVQYAHMKKDKPAKADVMKMILGPTGNLRAPTLRKGRTLVVGFHEDTYKNVFK